MNNKNEHLINNIPNNFCTRWIVKKINERMNKSNSRYILVRRYRKSKLNGNYRLFLDEEYYGGVNQVFKTKDLAERYMEDNIPSEVWDNVKIIRITQRDGSTTKDDGNVFSLYLRVRKVKVKTEHYCYLCD